MSIINALSCSRSDVSDAIDLAVNRDTVIIPAGSATWTSTLNISKGIQLIGSGIGVTIITDGINRSSIDSPMLQWDFGTEFIELSNLSILHNVTPKTFNGSIRFFGSGILKLHDIYTISTNLPFLLDGHIYGVMYKCIFDLTDPVANGIRIGHSSWNGYTYGDGSWADNPYLGSDKFFFIEDNIFQCSGTSENLGAAVNDINYGGRVVFRYNTVLNSFFQGHSFEVRNRGARLAEVYNNTFNWTDLINATNFAIFWRTGSLLVWGNTCVGYINLVNTVNDRSYRTDVGGSIWATCGIWNGSPSNWDQNLDTLGYAALDQPGRGKCDLIIGDTPTPSWPNQSAEPIYVWNNNYIAPAGYGSATLFGVQSNIIQANRDYYLGISKPNYIPYIYPHPLRNITPIAHLMGAFLT